MKSFTTFRDVSPYQISTMTTTEPSCFNGMVNIRQYKITIEEVEEPKEVLEERLRKLWRECSNFHHWGPLQAEAKKLGINLDEK